MLEVELKSQELKEYLYAELGKDRSEPIYDADLARITELDLDKIDLLDEQTDISMEDIVFFNNLKRCYLGNFILNDRNINLLNSKKSLEFLQINNCVFTNHHDLELGVQDLVIVDSQNVQLSKLNDFGKMNKLRIVNCVNTDIDGISKFKNLKKIYLQNLNLNSVNEISKLPDITYVNLNGSKLQDDSFVKNNTDVIIEHEDINAIYDSED